jgi:hypothetical protein
LLLDLVEVSIVVYVAYCYIGIVILVDVFACLDYDIEA